MSYFPGDLDKFQLALPATPYKSRTWAPNKYQRNRRLASYQDYPNSPKTNDQDDYLTSLRSKSGTIFLGTLGDSVIQIGVAISYPLGRAQGWGKTHVVEPGLLTE